MHQILLTLGDVARNKVFHNLDFYFMNVNSTCRLNLSLNGSIVSTLVFNLSFFKDNSKMLEKQKTFRATLVFTVLQSRFKMQIMSCETSTSADTAMHLHLKSHEKPS